MLLLPRHAMQWVKTALQVDLSLFELHYCRVVLSSNESVPRAYRYWRVACVVVVVLLSSWRSKHELHTILVLHGELALNFAVHNWVSFLWCLIVILIAWRLEISYRRLVSFWCQHLSVIIIIFTHWSCQNWAFSYFKSHAGFLQRTFYYLVAVDIVIIIVPAELRFSATHYALFASATIIFW